jgi:Domain of unknown function (DUF4399)
MTNCFARATAALAVALSLAACGYGSSTGSTTRGRVFFVQPKDGAAIKPMSTFEFGSEGVTVAAVPPGTLTPEQVRAGMIHYHLGVDTECLPAGTVIPKADPWVHFGDGKNVIEMSMTPGKHKVALQAGDDMHRTIEGLCQIINVTVAP